MRCIVQSVSEEHVFDLGRLREHAVRHLGSDPRPPAAASSGGLKSANAADWLHARNAEAAAGSRNGSATGGDLGRANAAEQVKLDASGFHKRQRRHAGGRRADSRGSAGSGHRGSGGAGSNGGSSGSSGGSTRHAKQAKGVATSRPAEQNGCEDSGSGSGSGSDTISGKAGARRGNTGAERGSGSGTDGEKQHDRQAEQENAGGSSRGRPQGRRGDAARCGRGVPHDQQDRFCCEGLFTCGLPGSQSPAAAPEVHKATHPSAQAAATTVAAAVSAGGLRIDCARVNDNFADCPDGSDEPGTSAAGHLGARFACHDGTTIPASFVDDGICDCCDGGDERPPRGRCRNRCAAKVDEDLAYI